MNTKWAIVEPRQVLKNRRIRLPEVVQEVVETIHPEAGPSIYWNYERHSKFVVISNEFLRQQKENYVEAGRTKILFPDEKGLYNKIRPPQDLGTVILSYFVKDEWLYYLAYEDMIEGEVRSVFLLTEDQIKDILPQDYSEGEEIKEYILNTPGILPSV